MIFGIPKEVKTHEYRVSISPEGARQLLQNGHEVYLETQAGLGAGWSDLDYQQHGVRIFAEASEVWEKADWVIKVKEPQPSEYAYLNESTGLFTYLHLAASPELTQELIKRRVTALAYETLQVDGELPLLKPMSIIAGKVAIQEAAHYLTRPSQGPGILLNGIEGLAPLEVLVFGAGQAGQHAARSAALWGSHVVLADINPKALERAKVNIETPNLLNVEYLKIEKEGTQIDLGKFDLIVGAVLSPGGKAPIVLNTNDLSKLKSSCLLVDISIDQGGCFATSRPTTHDQPIFEVEGIRHYCVANIPGAVPQTASQALTAATLPYILDLKNQKPGVLIDRNHALYSAVNTFDGQLFIDL